MNTEALLFTLLRVVLETQPEDTVCRELFTQEALETVYALAKKHDLTHLAGQGLAKLGLLGKDEISDKFRKHTMAAVRRYMLLQNALMQLCAAFEKAQIPFIPLKGSVLRDFYPESWMRTSCDIDFFVKEEDLQTLHTLLTEKMQYKHTAQWGTEITYLSPTGVHFELHYGILEESDDAATEAVLQKVWDMVKPAPGCEYHKQMPDELFYFHHLAHMGKHFMEGGCGIRPVMDIWILQNRMGFDEEKRNALLQEGGLFKFAKGMESLSDTWFSQTPADHITQSLGRYLLDGGLYGTAENRVAIRQGKEGSKVKYMFSRIFLPYDIMKNIFPVLQKHKWLLPVMEVWRWLRTVFGGKLGNSMKEMQVSMQYDTSAPMSTQTILAHLGLKETV